VIPKVIAGGDYAILDLETTDLSRYAAEAVQVAFGQIDRGRTGLRGYYTLLPHRAISAGAADKHGFTYEKLQGSPHFSDIAVELRTLLGSRILLGFGNKGFDAPILQRQFGEAGIVYEPPILDILFWSRRLMPGGKHNLLEMTKRLEIPELTWHDAWHDCRMAWQIFGQLATRYPELGELSPDEAVAAQEKK
jgi:DNA polymerase III epsilon subunit-like protein